MTGLRHEFVEFIPDELASNTIYISISFATVAHRCCCGCGNEVVTPLSPLDWQLTFDGETVSLYPSIGNWSFPCRSHYWIVRNGIRWAEQWSDDQIAACRAVDAAVKTNKFGNAKLKGKELGGHKVSVASEVDKPKNSLFGRLKKRLFG